MERVRVPGDRPIAVVRAESSPPTTVFLPGVCGNATAYLQTFPEAAKKHGGVVAIEGDQPCGSLEGYRTFSWDATRLHARIEAALAAAGLREIPDGGLTIVGYSQGASLGEQLAQRWPDRYTRIVLVGAPTDPAPGHFAAARAVVTMSCSRDVPARMRDAARGIAKSGTPATYFEMPGCTHGSVAEAEDTFDATFSWLSTSARPPRTTAAAVPLVGPVASGG